MTNIEENHPPQRKILKQNTLPRGILSQVVLLTVVRTTFNTANRMVYPFLAVFARGLGVDLAGISWVMSARSFTAVCTPFLAPSIERRGRKFGMLMAVALFTLANTALFLFPTYAVFFVSQCISYLSLYLMYSTVHAYVGDQVPYAVRGRIAAIFEFSWSLSFMVGVPLMGLLISGSSWRSPFPVFAGIGLLAFLLIMRLIPNPKPGSSQQINLLEGFRTILNSRTAVTGLLFSLLFHLGNETINLVFGVWLEDSFGFKIAALGAAALVIGVADFLGESLSAVFVDKLGKKRSVAIGITVNLISLVLLFLAGHTLWSAMASLFLLFLSFEFVVVSFLPVMSEVLPNARATLLSYDVAAHAAGRGFGAIIASSLYALGFSINIAASAVIAVCALVLLSKMDTPAEKGVVVKPI
ncbi:MAG: MFS transporter [Chloroflexi bacterium]|nr:MFS transporter [Chloroflexota bacterium]